MKRFLITFALLLGIFFGMQTNAHAAYYPPHLNGDPDYILTDGHQGVAYYMKRSSLNVEQYAPPIYVISVSVYTVVGADRGNTNYNRVTTMRFRYDWDNIKMYVQNGRREWHYLEPLGSGISTGEMAFYVAYRKKFYGRQKWKSGNNYYDALDEEFYSWAD